jgi:hypothetical protein
MSDGHLKRTLAGLRVAVEDPLGRVVAVGVGEAVGILLFCNLLPVIKVEGDF